MEKAKAFTLAEVLITLGIIGIVAAMTLPTLVQKHQEQVTVTQLKKAYSILSQAMMFAVNEDGTADNWSSYSYEEPEEAGITTQRYEPYNLIKRLKFAKDCKFESKGCFVAGGYRMLNGRAERDFETLNNQYYKAILADGAAIAIEGYEPDLSTADDRHYGEIWVDVNGSKKPNVAGKDLFLFVYTKNRILPSGYNRANGPLSATKCELTHSGYDCATWVLSAGNLDYLYCNDLSFNGKTKCK